MSDKDIYDKINSLYKFEYHYCRAIDKDGNKQSLYGNENTDDLRISEAVFGGNDDQFDTYQEFDDIEKIEFFTPLVTELSELRVLAIHNIIFDKFTNEISNLSKLKFIQLSFATDELISNLSPLTNLNQIVVKNYIGKIFPSSLQAMDNLTYLELNAVKERGALINVNMDIISKLQKLKILRLSNFKIDVLSDNILALTQLKELYLVNCDLNFIDCDLTKLQYLTVLNLSKGNLDTFSFLGVFSKLKTLILSHNKFNSLPDDILLITNLEQLDISHNAISMIEVINIAYVRPDSYIDLSYNKITSDEFITHSFDRQSIINAYEINGHKHAFHMNLSYNPLGRIHPLLFLMTKGRRNINYAGMELSFIPDRLLKFEEELDSIDANQYLHLQDNKITTTDELLRNSEHYCEIYLSGNLISSISADIEYINIDWRRKELVLDLSNNKIKEIRQGINFGNVVHLDLSGNQLEDNVIQIKADFLEKLNLSANKISKFPYEMKKLPSLLTLDLRDNLIKVMDRSLGRIKELYGIKNIMMAGNPIKVDYNDYLSIKQRLGALKDISVIAKLQEITPPESLEEIKGMMENMSLWREIVENFPSELDPRIHHLRVFAFVNHIQLKNSYSHENYKDDLRYFTSWISRTISGSNIILEIDSDPASLYFSLPNEYPVEILNEFVDKHLSQYIVDC